MPYDEQAQQQLFLRIASWQQSGLSPKAYCEQPAIRYPVFHYCYKRYRDQQTPEAGFVPLYVQPSGSPAAGRAPMELVLPDGTRLLFHHPVSSAYLKALIR